MAAPTPKKKLTMLYDKVYNNTNIRQHMTIHVNKYVEFYDTIRDYADCFVYLIPKTADEIPSHILNIVHTLIIDPYRASQKHFEDKYLAQYADVREPLLWRFFTIWAYILMDCCNLNSIEGEEAPLIYMCADKAIMFGDDIASGYIKAWVMYFVYCEYLESDYVQINNVLAPGLAQGRIEHIYLKAKILCNEDDIDNALPYLLDLVEARHTQGIRLFIKEYIHNPDKPSHYAFLGEIKTRTYTVRLKAYLDSPPEDVSRFLQKKETGVIGQCPICYEPQPLIFHDCREITHALCVICYCKTAGRCPTCRFSQSETKKRLIGCIG